MKLSAALAVMAVPVATGQVYDILNNLQYLREWQDLDLASMPDDSNIRAASEGINLCIQHFGQGAKLEIRTCSDSVPAQLWSYDDGNKAIMSEDGLCMEYSSTETVHISHEKEGGSVLLMSCSGAPEQQFILERGFLHPGANLTQTLGFDWYSDEDQQSQHPYLLVTDNSNEGTSIMNHFVMPKHSPPTTGPTTSPSLSPSDIPSIVPTVAPTPRPTAPPTTYYVLDYVGKATATVSTNAKWTMSDASILVDGDYSSEPLSSKGATYTSQTCEEPLEDIGYVTIDLGESQDVDGVRVHMYQKPGEDYTFCNMYINAWDGDIDDGPEVPITGCPFRTPSPTTDAPKATTAPVVPSKCFTCGDLDTQTPCTRREMLPRNSIQCDAKTPYCMNDIFQENNQRPSVYKRCVNEDTCRTEWYLESSDKAQCFEYDPNVYTLALVCHLCCLGDECNASLLPPQAKLYKPDRRFLQQVTMQDTSVYSSYCGMGYENVAMAEGMTFPIYPRRRVRYIRVWAGRSSANATVGFLEIQPLTTTPPPDPTAAPIVTDAPTYKVIEDFDFVPATPTSAPTEKMYGGHGDVGGVDEKPVTDFTFRIDPAAPPDDDLIFNPAAPPEDAMGGVVKGSSSGDPHFKTFSGTKFDFHGGCDLVLLHSPNFEKGLGLRVHIRTKIETWWSFIETAVVKVGQESLEVTGGHDGGKYWLNGQLGEKVQDGDMLALSGFEVGFRQVSPKQKRFRIDFGHGDVLSIETFKDWVAVNIRAQNKEQFQGSAGLMGSYPGGAMLARDGVTLHQRTDSFGKEWQVRANEPMLFHSLGDGVHHPQSCAMPDKTIKRRRLGEVLLTEEDAAVACSHADEDDQDACMFDVLATNDREMAGAY